MKKSFDGTKPIVLVGFGALGQQIAAGAKAQGLNVVAVVDNGFTEEKINVVPEGVSILHMNDFHSLNWIYDFVICAIRDKAHEELRAQLEAMGVKNIYHATDLLRVYPETVELARPGNRDQIRGAKENKPVFADEFSSIVFDSICSAWSGDKYPGFAESPEKHLYFDRSFYKPLENEVFVDCGAFDGDTVAQFMKVRNGKHELIVAFEPDDASFFRLQARVQGLYEEYPQSRILMVNSATTDRDGVACSKNDGSPSSKLIEGNANVPCTTLDSVCDSAGIAPTLIKLDIEGSEIAALNGARETIKKYRPVIACVTYHRPEDVWQVPKLLHEIVPEYRLYLRKYGPYFYEHVCYAVPEGREVNAS